MPPEERIVSLPAGAGGRVESPCVPPSLPQSVSVPKPPNVSAPVPAWPPGTLSAPGGGA